MPAPSGAQDRNVSLAVPLPLESRDPLRSGKTQGYTLLFQACVIRKYW